jgi:hypothetical protein
LASTLTNSVGPALWGERPISLENDALRRRIYAPSAYAAVRDAAVVPVVHSEAYRFAAWFPLVWRGRGSEIDFVVVRSLLHDQRAQPPAARGILPLVLQAYPFILDPKTLPTGSTRKMLDDAIADNPNDIGASITTISGRLSRATLLRFRILDELSRQFPVTRAITEAIAKLGVFEPWKLEFEIDHRPVIVPDLLIIRKDAFETGIFSSIMEEHGSAAGLLLGLHRISIFRAGLLLAMVRNLLRVPEGSTHGKARSIT